jgi:hypothetical protein
MQYSIDVLMKCLHRVCAGQRFDFAEKNIAPMAAATGGSGRIFG